MSNGTKTLLAIIVILILIWIGYAIVKSGPGTAGPTATTTPVSTEPVKIGFSGPLSGDLANVGQNAKAAVEIAVEEINTAGGIAGRQMLVVYEDDKCKGDVGATVASKLVSVDKVAAILGPACSPAALAQAPVVEAAKTPLLSYCATAPSISDAGDYVFRDVPSDLFQAKYAANYLYNTMGKRQAAVVYINQDWGNGLKDAFKAAFEGLGGKVVLEEGYAPDATDLRAQMTKVKNSKADVLYFPGFTQGTIAGLKQAKQLGITLTKFGADAWDDGKIWSELKPAESEGVMFTAAATNSSEEFKAKMLAKVGNNEIIYCSNYAYDGMKILAGIIANVGTDGTAIKDAFYKVRYEGGVAQPVIEFDEKGDPRAAEYFIKTVKAGKAEVTFPAPVAPAAPTATSTATSTTP